uniref:Uncharacterized protein n=1 Tax=Oryza sativa subsp. japonica TaxID=39947 RepID=Q6Z630_ORYSJ|nr:hypothetical protein [Oryza sativa Japonica Group]
MKQAQLHRCNTPVQGCYSHPMPINVIRYLKTKSNIRQQAAATVSSSSNPSSSSRMVLVAAAASKNQTAAATASRRSQQPQQQAIKSETIEGAAAGTHREEAKRKGNTDFVMDDDGCGLPLWPWWRCKDGGGNRNNGGGGQTAGAVRAGCSDPPAVGTTYIFVDKFSPKNLTDVIIVQS